MKNLRHFRSKDKPRKFNDQSGKDTTQEGDCNENLYQTQTLLNSCERNPAIVYNDFFENDVKETDQIELN